MQVHILGIAGTFMGGVAILAHEMGAKVTGCDTQVYPPMSQQLEQNNIELTLNYEAEQLEGPFDELVVGNVVKRGMPVIETALNRNLPLYSGPEWLAKHILPGKWVLAVSGTHGKTSTASLLAWILEYAGLQPGFLIGGVPSNFGVSARLGKGQFFVVEADEYDCALFDKRSKFVHYRPRTLIINNLEYDHADIFPNLAAIQQQFHHLVRTVAGNGLIVHPAHDKAVDEVLAMGCWTPQQASGVDYKSGWHIQNWDKRLSTFNVAYQDKIFSSVQSPLLGQHNVQNALAAIAAAQHAGVAPEVAIAALAQFKGVKRRMELKGEREGIAVYDDFAHHPTAIQTTLEGLRQACPDSRIIAVVDIRSNTMRLGHHKDDLPQALQMADEAYLFHDAQIPWSVTDIFKKAQKPGGCFTDIELLVQTLRKTAKRGDKLVFMSNGSFQGVHQKFLEALQAENIQI
jgi:UDP-N-acetylmuramate: L-alanyl-gamma-D-glutamyl-meso-diaminopimelate ligase